MKDSVDINDLLNVCGSLAKLCANSSPKIVLCKDCKYAEKYDPYGVDIICNNKKHTILDYVSPDWFCADGVERDKGDEE